MNKLLLIITLLCLLVGCKENKNDVLEVYNKSSSKLDNVRIDIKSGYFFDNYEKFTVDENTIGVTVYFSIEDDGWSNQAKK